MDVRGLHPALATIYLESPPYSGQCNVKDNLWQQFINISSAEPQTFRNIYKVCIGAGFMAGISEGTQIKSTNAKLRLTRRPFIDSNRKISTSVLCRLRRNYQAHQSNRHEMQKWRQNMYSNRFRSGEDVCKFNATGPPLAPSVPWQFRCISFLSEHDIRTVITVHTPYITDKAPETKGQQIFMRRNGYANPLRFLLPAAGCVVYFSHRLSACQSRAYGSGVSMTDRCITFYPDLWTGLNLVGSETSLTCPMKRTTDKD
ncbi:hypothetical protein TcasGA2_TC016396 [Tribolium castaneum]|uniref:Uncharacterized protein n=1 Tax=Tribolium castaneum TaxID=7070 RepID=D2CFY1_TRICA|nr:hypothetical protein TcasGA2_TC016396 [Tribolium castaneum]